VGKKEASGKRQRAHTDRRGKVRKTLVAEAQKRKQTNVNGDVKKRMGCSKGQHWKRKPAIGEMG